MPNYRDNKNSRDEIHLSTIEFFVANGRRHMQQADRAVIGENPPGQNSGDFAKDQEDIALGHRISHNRLSP